MPGWMSRRWISRRCAKWMSKDPPDGCPMEQRPIGAASGPGGGSALGRVLEFAQRARIVLGQGGDMALVGQSRAGLLLHFGILAAALLAGIEVDELVLADLHHIAIVENAATHALAVHIDAIGAVE